jgi:hypothetical protein
MKNLRTVSRDIKDEKFSRSNRAAIVKKSLKKYSSKLARRLAKEDVSSYWRLS